MNKLDIKGVVQGFLKGKERFKVISEGLNRPVVTPLTRQLLILDSSFNPPHLGHLSMIRQAIMKVGTIQENYTAVSSINTKSVLLLFSVNNADKGTAETEEYVRRLHMVELMSEYISTELGVACCVALTNASLFVDKSDLINGWLRQRRTSMEVETYFLLGFDTLIRLLDAKYYDGNINEVLARFFKSSRIVVFLRNDPSCRMAVAKQVQFLHDLTIDDNWKQRIVQLESPKEWGINSSAIRANPSLLDTGNVVIPSIRDFLKRK